MEHFNSNFTNKGRAGTECIVQGREHVVKRELHTKYKHPDKISISIWKCLLPNRRQTIIWANDAIVNRLMYIMPQSHWPSDHVATYIRPQSTRIADKSLTNGAIDLRICGWSYEQTLSQQGRWSCSKLRTCDYKSQEVAHRLYTTSHQGSYHQSRMIVGWQIAQLVWRLTGRPLVWSCHL